MAKPAWLPPTTITSQPSGFGSDRASVSLIALGLPGESLVKRARETPPGAPENAYQRLARVRGG
jgi:hypothetical protein